jgi:peptidyl-prolyl cis-trans isomerase C
MLNKNKFALLAILAAMAISPAFAEEKSAAVVNGTTISQEQVEKGVQQFLMQRGVQDINAIPVAQLGELRKKMLTELIGRELMAQEAKKAGLDKTPDVSQQIEQAKQALLASAFVNNYIKTHPVTEAQLQTEFELLKAKLGDKLYNMRVIVVETKPEAVALIAQLGKKAKFEELAKKSSIHAQSAAQGGMIGWNLRNVFGDEFTDTLMKMKKGEYTKEPVQTQLGWNIVRLEEVRPSTIEDFRAQLQQRLEQKSLEKAISDLRKDAKID